MLFERSHSLLVLFEVPFLEVGLYCVIGGVDAVGGFDVHRWK